MFLPQVSEYFIQKIILRETEYVIMMCSEHLKKHESNLFLVSLKFKQVIYYKHAAYYALDLMFTHTSISTFCKTVLLSEWQAVSWAEGDTKNKAGRILRSV